MGTFPFWTFWKEKNPTANGTVGVRDFNRRRMEPLINLIKWLGRVNFAQETDVLASIVTDDVFSVRLFSLRENICIRFAVGFETVQNPVGLTGVTSAYAPIRCDGPGTVCIAADVRTLKEFWEFFSNCHCRHYGCLLVEDSVNLDEIGCCVGDVPGVPASARVFASFVADYATQGAVFGTFHTYERELIVGYGDGSLKEFRDVAEPVYTDGILSSACLFVDLDDSHVILSFALFRTYEYIIPQFT